jgi:hypothetical protein
LPKTRAAVVIKPHTDGGRGKRGARWTEFGWKRRDETSICIAQIQKSTKDTAGPIRSERREIANTPLQLKPRRGQ